MCSNAKWLLVYLSFFEKLKCVLYPLAFFFVRLHTRIAIFAKIEDVNMLSQSVLKEMTTINLIDVISISIGPQITDYV